MAAPPDLVVRPAPAGLSQHIGRTLRLALPVMASRAGLLLLAVVDTAMTGHAGPEQLAYYALAMAVQIFVLLVGIGLLLGTVVMTAQADGAGRPADCGAVWRVALVHAALIGLVQAALMYGGEGFLGLAGQGPALAEGGGRVMVVLGWSLPAMLLFIATTLFLEGIGRPLPSLLIMLVANGLNAGLNWLLIYGHWGLPALGAEGAALATTLVRWFMCMAVIGYALGRVDRRHYGLTGPIPDFRRIGRTLRRIGYPMALTQGLESGAFSTMTLFAGLIGPIQVAAYQIAMTLIALVFMCAQGFTTAASIRVGNAVGRGDQGGIRTAGWTAVGLSVGMLALFSLLFATYPQALTALYTDDPRVTAVTVAALLVVAWVLVPDGLQAVFNGALRGVGDVWPATGLFLIAFWGVMIPAGYWLGVARGAGAVGLVQAILLGTTVAACCLALRFQIVSRRVIRRL
ncbi:MAG: MATE family efflux transporter [Candidatus Competibacterales bacterium]|nr:MATE family efflux transporter [Candidatus Competibacterales bacterium]